MNRQSIPAWLQLLLMIALLLAPQPQAPCQAQCSGQMTSGHASMGACAPGAMRRSSCCTRSALAANADLAPMLCHCSPVEALPIATPARGAKPDQTVLLAPVTRLATELGATVNRSLSYARPPGLADHDPGVRLNLPIRI